MDISLVIRHRLDEPGLDQRDLASAAQVTESYISQLLARKNRPLQEQSERISAAQHSPLAESRCER